MRMAESDLQCEPCQHDNVTKSASKWCTECEESLCDACCRSHKAHKISRNHHVIAVGGYHQTEKLNLNLDCPEHSKRLDFHCPTHDSVVCVACVQSKHGSCKDLRPINEAAEGAKTSTALNDLEQTIDGLLENIERGAHNLQQSKTNIMEQIEERKNSITNKRAEIDKHLDRLQVKIFKRLKSDSEKEENKMSLIATKLKEKRNTILDLKHTTENMRTYSSNLQVFVAMRRILTTVVNEINEIKPLLRSIPQLSIAVQFNPKFVTFTDDFDSLGEIQIKSKEAVVPYVERRFLQAQYPRNAELPVHKLDKTKYNRPADEPVYKLNKVQYQRPVEPPVQKLDNLNLELRTNINMGKTHSNVKCCLILPNKSIMIASYNKPSLTILKEEGSHDRDISVPYNPYDVTRIDDRRVAVSYGNKCISIVNIKTKRTNRTFENLCKKMIWGITYNDGKLYAVAYAEGIKVINLDGNIVKTIRIYNDALCTYKVTIHQNKIYYSVKFGSIYCVDMTGTEIWMCHDDRLHNWTSSPAIAVDNNGITFAAGYNSNLLLAISSDGKQKKVLLSSADGLQNPNAAYFDKNSKRLLICNRQNGHAAFFSYTSNYCIVRIIIMIIGTIIWLLCALIVLMVIRNEV